MVDSAAEFSGFYRLENDAQVRRAALILRSSEAASDVVHDAFVKIYRMWETLDSPGPYLNQIVLNGCRDYLRREKRLAALLPKLADHSTNPAHEVLSDVLDALPFNQRAAVILRYYDGMTEAEIAEALDCAPGSVGPWISRAIASMNSALR